MMRLAKSIKMAVLATGLGAAAALAAPTAAMANGNWSHPLGPTGAGCFGWTNWTSNQVTAHVYSQSGDDCWVEETQYWRSQGRDAAFFNTGDIHTTGSGTTATAPSNWTYDYLYYGPSGTDQLCVQVFVGDNTHLDMVQTVYGASGC